MSHNSKFYKKKLNKNVADGSKKIDILFKQSLLSSSTCQSTSGDQNSSVIENTSKTHHDSSSVSSTDIIPKIHNPSLDIDKSSDSESENELSCVTTPVPDTRKFTSSNYESRFNWLYYSAAKMGYCCKLCEVFCPVQDNCLLNPFVLGVSLGSHPSRKLMKHNSSKNHVAACMKQSKINFENSNEPLVLTMLQKGSEKQKSDERTRNRQYMSALIKTMCFVIQNNLALDFVSDIMDHIHVLGTPDVVNYLVKHPNLKYTSPTSVTEILKSINIHLESSILEKLRKADAYALLADESSDEGHREQFAVLIRFINDGKVGDHYVGIIEVRRTDAASLMAAIELFLLAKQIDIKKATFVGFDGCNTMSGENKGLQRRFRHVVPHQLYIHCRNHRLALCIKHLIKDFPIIDVVDGVLLSIWKLFHYSPKKFATFQSVQESYGLKKLRLIRASTTRWLSHGTACLRLVVRFVQVIDTLDQCLAEKYDAEVHGIREQLLNKNTFATILVLCDVLQPVILFSDYLQGTNIFSDVMIRCNDLVQELHLLIARFQTNLVTPDDSLNISKLNHFFDEIDDRTALGRRMRQNIVLTPRQIVMDVALPLTYGLINEITDAFHCSPVIEGFSIFNMKNVPESMTDMDTYGNPQIDALAKHYGNPREDVLQGHRSVAEPKYTEVEYRTQFKQFKIQLCLMKQRGSGDPISLFQQAEFMNSFPAVNHLVNLSQLIPSSTASVERLFSLMNLLCTPLRNRLSEYSLDVLMRICLHGDISDRDVDSVIDVFNQKDRSIDL